MRLNSGEFETNDDGSFEITIRQESDWSTDGGHTYENVANTYELSAENARHLITELQEFCAKYK